MCCIAIAMLLDCYWEAIEMLLAWVCIGRYCIPIGMLLNWACIGMYWTAIGMPLDRYWNGIENVIELGLY